MANDPCDEMVTVREVVTFFTDKMRPGWPTVDKLYERIAAILGVSRDEAKRAVYHFLYGGK